MKWLIVFLLLSSPAWATWSAPTGSSQTCTSTSSTCNVSYTTQSGKGSIVVSVYVTGGTVSVSSASDTLLNSYTVATGQTSGANTLNIVYAANTTLGGGSTNTITVTLSAAPNATWTLRSEEFKFTAASAAFDTSAHKTNSGTSQSGNSLTLAGANELVYEAAMDTSGNITAVSGGSGTTGNNGAFSPTVDAWGFNTSSWSAFTYTFNASVTGMFVAVALKEVSPKGMPPAIY